MKNNKVKIIVAVIGILLIGIITCVILKPNNPKYIFLFIGDGMSSTQVELTEIYKNSIQYKEPSAQEKLSFTNFKTIGLRKNYSMYNYTPDSAASGTALASGLLTYNGSINTDIDGNEVKPITYDLQAQNKKIGIITTMSINHATPAAFYAASASRTDYDDIAYDLVNSGFDYFAGGGFHLKNASLTEIKNYATEHGYTIIDSEDKLNDINKNNKNIILSPTHDSENNLLFAMDNRTEFNLENYVKTAIDVLDNKKGFFIMAESGLIDYAGHNNDARGVISEVEELNKAVEVALEFAKKHPDETLIIVTGDHETGGLTLGTENNVHELNLERLQNQTYSYEALVNYARRVDDEQISYENVINYLATYYGVRNIDLQEEYEKTINGDSYILKTTVMNIIAEESGINYSTTYHTADRIPVYAYGVGSEKFAGIYNTSEFNYTLRSILK